MKKEEQKIIMHDFGDTDPNAECYGNYEKRIPTCGIRVSKERVTNYSDKVTCKRCLKLKEVRT